MTCFVFTLMLEKVSIFLALLVRFEAEKPFSLSIVLVHVRGPLRFIPRHSRTMRVGSSESKSRDPPLDGGSHQGSPALSDPIDGVRFRASREGGPGTCDLPDKRDALPP